MAKKLWTVKPICWPSPILCLKFGSTQLYRMKTWHAKVRLNSELNPIEHLWDEWECQHASTANISARSL